MTKKNWILLATALVVAGIYIFFFSDWLAPKTILIHHVSRDTRTFRRPNALNAPKSTTIPVTFGFDTGFKLTEVKVVPLAAWQTNQNVLPLWHMIAGSNSVAVKFFVYGQNIPGLKPAIPGTHADELQPGVSYRLLVTAGKITGHHDFQPIAR